jgi:hypothetical protein
MLVRKHGENCEFREKILKLLAGRNVKVVGEENPCKHYCE